MLEKTENTSVLDSVAPGGHTAVSQVSSQNLTRVFRYKFRLLFSNC